MLPNHSRRDKANDSQYSQPNSSSNFCPSQSVDQQPYANEPLFPAAMSSTPVPSSYHEYDNWFGTTWNSSANPLSNSYMNMFNQGGLDSYRETQQPMYVWRFAAVHAAAAIDAPEYRVSRAQQLRAIRPYRLYIPSSSATQRSTYRISH